MSYQSFGIVFTMTLTLLTANVTHAADWLGFRGSDHTSVVDSSLTEDLSNIAWKVDLPGRGLSSPVVVGDQVLITASEGFRQDRLLIMSFDANKGSLNWSQEFFATGRTGCHEKTSVAAPSPVSDGKAIYVFYSSNDAICLELDGSLRWFRGLMVDYPNASNSLGMSSSLALIDNVLICQMENDAQSVTVGLETKTGKTVWELDRPRAANWTSPTVFKDPLRKKTVVLLQSSEGVSAIDPQSGDQLWSYSDGASTIPSSVISQQTVLIPSNGLTRIKPSFSDPEILWQQSNLRPGTASPVVDGDNVYVINRAGVISSADMKEGKRQWQFRTEGPYSATPLVSNGKMYLFNEKGLGQVVALGQDGGELISSFDLKQTILSTPAASNGAIYLRSDSTLWKISD